MTSGPVQNRSRASNGEQQQIVGDGNRTCAFFPRYGGIPLFHSPAWHDPIEARRAECCNHTHHMPRPILCLSFLTCLATPGAC